MNCRTALRMIVELDNGAVLNEQTLRHIGKCDGCRAEYQRMTQLLLALRNSHQDEHALVAESLTNKIMAAVHTNASVATRVRSETPKNRLHLANWIGCGLLLLLGMLTLPYNEVMNTVSVAAVRSAEAAIALSLGLTVSAFIAVFIGTNMGALRRLHRGAGSANP